MLRRCCISRFVAQTSQQVHVLADVIVLAVSTLGGDLNKVDAVFHGCAVVGTVPTAVDVIPLVDLLSPAVYDVGEYEITVSPSCVIVSVLSC